MDNLNRLFALASQICEADGGDKYSKLTWKECLDIACRFETCELLREIKTEVERIANVVNLDK